MPVKQGSVELVELLQRPASKESFAIDDSCKSGLRLDGWHAASCTHLVSLE
jgi:hypothetical protein